MIKDTRPNCAVVILNYNGKNHLEEYLPSVVLHTPEEIEIYVIDNGSSDNSVIFIQEQYPNIKLVLLDTNLGFCDGYNEGLKEIDQEILVILNSDIEVTKNWTKHCLDAFENDQKLGACQPKILALKNRTHFEHAGGAGGMMDVLDYPYANGRLIDLVEKDNGQYNKELEIFWATGASLFIRNDLFKKTGGFDSSYFAHFEEIDLCWRIRNLGYKIKYIPQSTVYHLGGGTLNYNNPRKVFYNFRNSLLTILKNETKLKLIWLIPLRLTLDGVAGVKFLSEGKFSSILAIIKAHFSFYRLIPNALRKRKAFSKTKIQMMIGKAISSGKSKKSILIEYYIKKSKNTQNL